MPNRPILLGKVSLTCRRLGTATPFPGYIFASCSFLYHSLTQPIQPNAVITSSSAMSDYSVAIAVVLATAPYFGALEVGTSIAML